MTRYLRGHDAGARTRQTERGFSFIEILIVMGIIGVLVGMVVVVLGIWARKGPKFITRQRLQKVAAGAREIQRTFESYAPIDVMSIPKAFMVAGGKLKPPRNKTNEGIETLVLALYWPGLKYDPQITDSEFCNTDEDELAVAVNKRSTSALQEIRDQWENPLIYIPAGAYGLVDADPVTYVTHDGEEVEVRPWRSDNGGFEQPDSFQLFSMGPDEKPNTEDDILVWRD